MPQSNSRLQRTANRATVLADSWLRVRVAAAATAGPLGALNMAYRRKYLELEITADTPTTEIWLGDSDGHLVQKSVGVLRSSLLPGQYVAEFGLGTPCYRVPLDQEARYTQSELRKSGAIERPIPEIPER